MAKLFDAKNWYWYVGADTSRAYSSATGDYVQAANPTFFEWMSDGTVATKIDTEANLGAVLSPHYPDVTRPAPAGILDAYQQDQADDIFKRKLSKLLFQMINDIRQLKGQAALTPAQAKAFVKGLM